MKHYSNIVTKFTIISTIWLTAFSTVMPNIASAADLTAVADTMTRQQETTSSKHTFTFTLPAGVQWAANQDLLVDFSGATTDFTLSATNTWASADFTITEKQSTVVTTLTAGTTSINVNATNSPAFAAGCGGDSAAYKVAISSDASLQNSKFYFRKCATSTISDAASPIVITIDANGSGTGGSITNPTLSAVNESEPLSISRNTTGVTDNTTTTLATTTIDYIDMAVGIVEDDGVAVTADLTPSITFKTATQATLGTTSSTGCGSSTAGTYVTGALSVALGTLTTSAVATSGVSAVNYICTDVTTNARGGASVTILSANGGLKSTSKVTDLIDSTTETLVGDGVDEGFGFCIDADGTDTGSNGSAVTEVASTCTTTTHGVTALSTITPAQIYTVTPAASGTGYATILLKAAISATATAPHDDYTDALTLIATATF